MRIRLCDAVLSLMPLLVNVLNSDVLAWLQVIESPKPGGEGFARDPVEPKSYTSPEESSATYSCPYPLMPSALPSSETCDACRKVWQRKELHSPRPQ
ncbi:hypothetical protein BD779DRAFT_84359 [Infundibulicybe gibba]|nr:hypothetical protein BD779DRAFT_84359 [Infundibulicybe gibba]